MSTTTEHVTVQPPVATENSKPSAGKSPAPVTVTISTVDELARAIGANRLKSAPASPPPQDAAPAAPPEDSHPSGDAPESEADLSKPTPPEGESNRDGEDAPAPTEAPAPEGEDAPAAAEDDTPEARIKRLERALEKKDKRIAKLTARLHEQEDEVGGEPGESKPEPAAPAEAPAPTMPPAPSDEMASLEARLAGLERLKEWLANDGAAGGAFTDERLGLKFEVRPEDVEGTARQAEAIQQQFRTEYAVAKREYVKAFQAEQAQLEAEFRQQFPALVRKDSPERTKFDHLMANLPAGLRTAGAKLVVAKALAYDALAAKSGNKPAAPRTVKANAEPAPVTARPAAAARPQGEAQKRVAEAKAAYGRSGSVKDLARMRAAERAAQV
jgi:hypothetical protein